MRSGASTGYTGDLGGSGVRRSFARLPPRERAIDTNPVQPRARRVYPGRQAAGRRAP